MCFHLCDLTQAVFPPEANTFRSQWSELQLCKSLWPKVTNLRKLAKVMSRISHSPRRTPYAISFPRELSLIRTNAVSRADLLGSELHQAPWRELSQALTNLKPLAKWENSLWRMTHSQGLSRWVTFYKNCCPLLGFLDDKVLENNNHDVCLNFWNVT